MLCFLVFVVPATARAVSFTGPTNFGVSSGPGAIAVADFNGDSRPDLVTANFGGEVSVLLGDGNGGFSGPINSPVADFLTSVAVGDFNGDSNPDLAVAGNDVHNVWVLLGDGSGNFSGPTSFPVGDPGDTEPMSLAVGDFNSDSKLDLVSGNYGGTTRSHDVSILLGDGNGGFAGHTDFEAGSPAYAVGVDHFNDDSYLDLVIVEGECDQVSVLTGDGSGGFSGPTIFSLGSPPCDTVNPDATRYPQSVAVGDLNGDSRPDVVTGNVVSDDVSVLTGDGAGGFAGPASFPIGDGTDYPRSVAIGDFDGDSKPDLATANSGCCSRPGNVSVLLGDGSGAFSGPINFVAHAGPDAVAVGDLNDDLGTDLAIGNGGSNDVSILLNTSPQRYPRPKGATPLRISLVPAYRACTTPNTTHGSPLASPSCNPPIQLSTYLTVGTPDVNGAAVNSVGSLQLNVKINPSPTPSDVLLTTKITDVRCKGGVSTCGSTNAAAGPDYTGELQATTQLRITDRFNGSDGTSSATVSDATFSVTVPCSATPETTTGATCAITTTANTVAPGSVQTGKRAIWQPGQVQVTDGGEDGVASTTTDNTLFMKQGVFVP